MGKEGKDQISQWLKKLERESWQLELLVSAFTIFLLIQAIGTYSEFLTSMQYQYNLGDSLLSFIYIFFTLVGLSIKALAMFLILHLLLRGFWIGAIGLRSVQSTVDFEQLNYSKYFTEKLKKKVISLDNLVVMLDEICSLMFSFAFLIISIILAFGLFLLFLGALVISMTGLANLTSGTFETIFRTFNAILFLTLLLSGFVYLIDYFTLGFFKKIKWLSKIYYPIYRFYGMVTLSVISKSIYYYLISRFSKRRIRIVYLLAGILLLFSYIADYNQYQFYPEVSSKFEVSSNQYDNLRMANKHIAGASIQSNVIQDKFIQLFIRYDPRTNAQIQSNCSELVPAKEDGFNWRYKLVTENMSFYIRPQDYEAEDKEQLLACLSSYYQISINDSIYSDLNFYFYEHPHKNQKGILALIDTEDLPKGENLLAIKNSFENSDGEAQLDDHSDIPFWLE